MSNSFILDVERESVYSQGYNYPNSIQVSDLKQVTFAHPGIDRYLWEQDRISPLFLASDF